MPFKTGWGQKWGQGKYYTKSNHCQSSAPPIPYGGVGGGAWFEGGPTIRVVFPAHPLTILKETGTADNGVPVNVPVNKRQQWFLEQLKHGVRCKPADIAVKWRVVEKTAKRDISDLQKKGLVKFDGAPKTVTYKLLT